MESVYKRHYIGASRETQTSIQVSRSITTCTIIEKCWKAFFKNYSLAVTLSCNISAVTM